MIESVKIKNLRSLIDTGFINIKKINILLGANSSGKSTFLRSFPLFTQSVKKNLRGPISWFDDSYVDFGDYQTAKNKYVDKDEHICFSYYIHEPYADMFYWRHSPYYYRFHQKQISNLYVTISLDNDSKGTFVNKIEIQLSGNVYRFVIASREDYFCFQVDDGPLLYDNNWQWRHVSDRHILPSLFPVKSVDDEPFLMSYEKTIFDYAKKFCDTRFKNLERLRPLITLWNVDKKKYLNNLIEKVGIPSFSKTAKEWNTETKEFLQIYNSAAFISVFNYLSIIDNELYLFYYCSDYIAPIRAEANRYYRSQGLQVNNIDSFGRNLQEFISSLSPKQKRSYNDYTKRLLGITVDTKIIAGHYSIVLKTDNGEFNMTDVGYGYSQILPILTKLWFDSTTNRQDSYRYFYYEPEGINLTLMEQPELHLHPALQAKIADAFIELVTNTAEDVNPQRLIVETHSPTIINRIGRRIREGKIDSSDVNVVIFQKDKQQKNTIVRQIGFDDKGQLTDWPFGFFDPED